jgi:probable HAF family extracellular repeat protein
MTDLGSLPGPPCCSDINNGIAINNVGQVAGYAYAGVYSFLYSNGQMMDIGSLSGRGATLANGINDAGQVVGSSNTANDDSHAFLYSDGQMTDLGTLGGRTSRASDINNAGQIVGSADVINPVPLYFSSDAFIYTNGQMRDLNDLVDPTLQIRLYRAIRINDIGQILAEGARSSEPCCGVPRPYLLTPVPEPSTLVLFGIAAAIGLCLCSRRRSTVVIDLRLLRAMNAPHVTVLPDRGSSSLA